MSGACDRVTAARQFAFARVCVHDLELLDKWTNYDETIYEWSLWPRSNISPAFLPILVKGHIAQALKWGNRADRF